MREIIHLQIGKAGNAAGTKFWEAICEEHGINPCGLYTGTKDDQLEKIDTYFNLTRRKEFVPRAVLVDLDQESVCDAKNSRFGRLFKPWNLIHGGGGTGNNWAKGFYTEGRMLVPPVLDSARREAEKCDCLQGFQIIHSIGGGTGSGFGSLILKILAEDYPGRCLNTHTILPSPNILDDRTQTYNTVIALQHLTEMRVETYCMDNKALEHICEDTLGMPKPGYEDLNFLIATAMAGITTTSRLPGRLNDLLSRCRINTVPFPRLHYLTPGIVPILKEGSKQDRPLTVSELSHGMINPKNMFIYPPTEGKYLTASYIYRGAVSPDEVRHYTNKFFRKNCQRYIEWIPDNVKTEVCAVPLRGLKTASAVVGNTTAMHVVFGRILQLFDSIHERKYYVRWFTDEGVTDEELDAAGVSLHDLVEEYKKCDAAMYDDVWHDVKAEWGGQF